MGSESDHYLSNHEVPNRPRALIVEDDRRWLNILMRLFSEAGFEVWGVTNAFEARAQLRDRRFDVATIDLILDQFDFSESGLEVVDALKSVGDSTYILLISAWSRDTELRTNLKRWPSIEFIPKSEFSRTTVQQLLARAQQRPAADSPSEAPADQNLPALWSHVLQDTNVKGKLLEEFAACLLSTVPGFELVERNYRTASSEIDLVFAIRHAMGDMFSDWGSLLLVECRNRSKAVDAKAIRDFSRKIQNADARVGLILSPKGITGSGLRDATAEVRTFFIETKRRVLVLNDKDIEAHLEGRIGIVQLLDRADRRVRLSV
jgi:ActR/RegA family two-component response regulator/Holliday junction resolvase-like predicted endonuclease